MADLPLQTPLITTKPDLENGQKTCQRQDLITDTDLDQCLQNLEKFLSFLGFNQTSAFRIVVSWFAFAVVGVLVPITALEVLSCSRCEHVNRFEVDILVSHACVSAVSLACVSHNLRKYGLRKFLFVDRYHGHRDKFRENYIVKIKVTSIIQVGGVILCLHAAVKISHRALGIVSVASAWHASVSCNCNDASQLSVSSSMGNFEAAANVVGSLSVCNSESDLDSLDATNIPTYARVTSYMSTFHKRQAFVMYLQTNPGGITIFGWAVNRTMIDTIFCAELSLVLFMLGKTLVFGTN
ncbi:hypothetical protein Sjap_019590 [Stephania japonica]|uniref:Uncharacterized protein n=1 Tax=Stephania japonica TaxID=461633 RepID=A0AAP0EZ34_9MAGN